MLKGLNKVEEIISDSDEAFRKDWKLTGRTKTPHRTHKIEFPFK